jgi:hypothetical protein
VRRPEDDQGANRRAGGDAPAPGRDRPQGGSRKSDARRGLALLAVAAFLAANTSADEPERPWAAGVAEARQAEARKLFDAGNLLFEQARYGQALSIYRDAVKAWDHPAIRYNMAVANIHLDQPLAAYEDLESALRFGSAPLERDAYAQALTYQKLLLGQLARLKVSCTEPGAQLFLDGELVLTGPGERSSVLLPGKHQLVASKPGFVAATRAVELVAGSTVEETLAPSALPRLAPVRTERRWAAWMPWAVAGAGAAVAAIGLPFQLAARSNMQDYDRQVGAACPTGCVSSAIPASTRDVESRARLDNGVAIGLFAVGGAALAGGIVLAVLNQPRPVEPPKVAVAPLLTDGRPGFVVSGRF